MNKNKKCSTNTIKDLWTITEHESGIIVYPNGEIAVDNWKNYNEECLPLLEPTGRFLIPFPMEGIFDGITMRDVADAREELPGTVWINDDNEAETDMRIMVDDNADIFHMFVGDYKDVKFPSTVYTLKNETKIIVPDDWH